MTRSLPVATTSPTNHTPAQRQRLDPRWCNMLLTIHIAVAVGVLGTDIVLLPLGTPALPAPTRSSSAPATSPWGYSRTPSCSRRR
jgi:hypothetical protein